MECQRCENLKCLCLESQGKSYFKMCTWNTVIHNVLKSLNTILKTYNQVLITTL